MFPLIQNHGQLPKWPALVCLTTLLACPAAPPRTTIEDSALGGAGGVGGAGGEVTTVNNSAVSGVGGSFHGDGGGEPIAPDCAEPPNVAGPGAVVAIDYDAHYTIFDLGEVPGVPDALGGCVVKYDDPNVLLIAGKSEKLDAQIYSIGIKRGPCNHIIGFEGTAQPVASTPYVDANLVYTDSNLMFYSQWPTYKLNQMLPGSTVPDRETDLLSLGIVSIGDHGPGGIGFVPIGNSGAGGLRIVTWPQGHWYHVGLQADGPLFNVTGLTKKTQLPNNPGGFAYVPKGSPGFPDSRLIVSEWVDKAPDGLSDRVATYALDAEGDPLPNTRKEFLSKIHRPWGAYFEPLTGDFLFLQWQPSGPMMQNPPDRVYIVQGFSPPPPPAIPR